MQSSRVVSPVDYNYICLIR